MRELLKRWSQIEPERCLQMALTDRFPTQFHVARRPPRLPTTVRFTAGGELQIGGGDELLAAVIEAVTSRGWLIDLEIEPSGTLASVYTSMPLHWTATTDEHPAQAALTAYVQALEAQAEA